MSNTLSARTCFRRPADECAWLLISWSAAAACIWNATESVSAAYQLHQLLLNQADQLMRNVWRRHGLHKQIKTRRALEKSSCSQGLGLEQGAASHPPDPHKFFLFPGGGDSRLFGSMCLLFLNRCKHWFHCLLSFHFLNPTSLIEMDTNGRYVAVKINAQSIPISLLGMCWPSGRSAEAL